MNEKTEKIFNLVLGVLMCMAVVVLIVVLYIKIGKLENKNINLEIELREAELYTEFLDELYYQNDEIWELRVENAVLNEQLKNQPSNEKHIEQILDDFELLIELQQHYYQENITSHIFWDWLQINYPALYERILSYY